jgi:hypothetical protein
MEQVRRGYYYVGDKYVCKNCFSDTAIKRYIHLYATNKKCDYCGRKTKSKFISVPTDDIVGLIVRCIEHEWGDPNDERILFEDGDWQGDVISSWELLHDEIEIPTENKKLQNDILKSIGDRQWCRINYYGVPPHEVLRYSWEDFCHFVKHHSRYVFLRYALPKDPWNDPDLIPSNRMLDELSKAINRIGLVRTIPANTKFTRVRFHYSTVVYDTAEKLGPPSEELAKYSNRMSPAGIPMFYGSTDKKTSIIETIQKGDERKNMATVAIFKTIKPFKILDLTKLPECPSLFDEDQREQRNLIGFLESFVRDVSRSISKDGREHIEYVPTQIFTEYFRYLFRDDDNDHIHGILYRSSKHRRGVCCVLFFTDKHFSNSTDKDQKNKWLSLDIKALKTVNISKYYKEI